MGDKAWKVWEREVAKDLGGVRAGPVGREGPDVIDVPGLAIQCKYQARLSLRKSDLEQARRDGVDSTWVLALKEAKTGWRLAVLDWRAFVALYRELEELRRACSCRR